MALRPIRRIATAVPNTSADQPQDKTNMKLTKMNARRLKAIQKALASGKGLGGLLVGLAAATVAAGCDGRIPFFTTAGKPANFHNEEPDIFVTEGEVPELPEPPEPATTNDVNEAKDAVPVLLGEPAPPPQNLPPLQPVK